MGIEWFFWNGCTGPPGVNRNGLLTGKKHFGDPERMKRTAGTGRHQDQE
jgi:hypothetical protein